MKINKLFFLLLFMLIVPAFIGNIAKSDNRYIYVDKSFDYYNNDQNADMSGFNDQDKSISEDQLQSFVYEVNDRLKTGESPETLVDLFVIWDTRPPDFPEWVSVGKTSNLMSITQISCELGKIEDLSQLRHVVSIAEIGTGQLKVSSEVDYMNDPYVGDYPLLLNETHSLISANTSLSAGAGVVIAILSTGIDENHPMLDDQDDDYSTADPKIVDSYDAWDSTGGVGSYETNDNIGWGTALASIVAGTGTCGGRFGDSITLDYPFPYDGYYDYETQEVSGFISVGSQMGIAPAASLLDVKITPDSTTLFNEASAIWGLEWAMEHGADIILLDVDNLGTSATTIIKAIHTVTSLGTLVVVPAGDYDAPSGYDDESIAPYYTINSPASAPSALTVGASTKTDKVWLSSERGPVPVTEISKPDVVAPGVNILAADHEYSTNEDNPGSWANSLYFDIHSSTVTAAAVTAGVAARLIESFPGASPTAVKIALRQGATDLGYNEMAQGKGKINLANANTILTNAPSIENNWIGNIYNETYEPSQLSYQDLTGKRILIDGSYSTSTSSAYYYDWIGLTNGDLDTLGTGSNWQHPYDDTSDKFTWYNVSYEGAENVRFTLNNLTLATGDNFTIFRSATPNDPDPTIMYGPATTNFTGSAGFTMGDDYFYFRWGSNGDGAATGHSVFGIYGSVELQYYARDITVAKPAGGEFDDLADELYSLGADVDYWIPNSANAAPTSTILEYYDVFMLPQPRAGEYGVTYYSMPNASAYYNYLSIALDEYHDNGGNILFIGDRESNLYNNATSSLGIEWINGGVGGPTTNFVSHSLLSYPFEIEELLIDAPLAHFDGLGVPVVYDGNVPSVVYLAPPGDGKAVFVADEDIFNDQLWDDPFSTSPDRYNNSQFALNIFYWLTDSIYQSGPTTPYEGFEITSLTSPKIMIDGTDWDLETTIQNTGNYTSQALVAMGLDWDPLGWINLPNAVDNANDDWDMTPDDDIGVSLNNTSIEFYYNISETHPVDQIALPFVALSATGMNRQVAECRLYFNGELLGPIYETNATNGVAGTSYYSIYPDTTLNQYNNRIEITVPFGINLTLNSLYLSIHRFTGDLGVQHYETANLSPNQDETFTFTYNPSIETVDAFEPDLLFLPKNLTHAWLSPGFGAAIVEHEIHIDYGTDFPGYFNDLNERTYGIAKRNRQGPLPILYEFTPSSFDPSSSTKIVNYPGDIRIDGLTIMSSVPIEESELRISGNIGSILGLGSYSESSSGLGSYSQNHLAPNYFYLNDTWAGTHSLILDDFTHTLSDPVLQLDIPYTQSSGRFTGEIGLYYNDSALYTIDLFLRLYVPRSSLLLADTTDTDLIGTSRDYDKLWDQLFEFWNIAEDNRINIDSLYQEAYLHSHRNNVVVTTATFLNDYVCNVPDEEELPYNGILGIGLDVSDLSPLDDFLERGGNLIQFGSNYHLGPTLSGDITYRDTTNQIATLINGDEVDHPLMEDVNQLFYFGGGYLEVDQQGYENEQDYDVISGVNWLNDNISNDIGVIYHDAIYADPFGYNKGKYSPTVVNQAYKGLKMVIGTDVLALNWLLECPEMWGYSTLKYASDQNYIPDQFNIDIDNRKFIENVLEVGSNSAPEIDSIEVSSRHVEVGDVITIHLNVSDDYTSTSDLKVIIPEKLVNNAHYVEMTYNNNTREFVGSMRIVDTSLLNGGWDVYVIDDLHRAGEAVDDNSFLLPEFNVKPTAWVPQSSGDEQPYLTMTDVSKGELYYLSFFYSDEEDATAIDCNISLVHYKNEIDTEVIQWELFSGRGQGTFFTDTSDLKSGTYIIVATVTDTDGGTASYNLVGFNIGKGTLYDSKPTSSSVDLGPVVGAAAVTTVVGGSIGGTALFLRKKGISIRDLIKDFRKK